MKVLLDTHAFLWLLLDSRRLSAPAAAAIRSPGNDVGLSAASALEIAIKQSIGKLTLPGPAPTWIPAAAERVGVDLIDLTARTALAVQGLPWHHRDPFDRLIVAQASQGHTLVTHDRALEPYGVPILWT